MFFDLQTLGLWSWNRAESCILEPSMAARGAPMEQQLDDLEVRLRSMLAMSESNHLGRPTTTFLTTMLQAAATTAGAAATTAGAAATTAGAAATTAGAAATTAGAAATTAAAASVAKTAAAAAAAATTTVGGSFAPTCAP
jgi:hypothetical protein